MMRKSRLLSIFGYCLLWCAVLYPQSEAELDANFNDGPYVYYQNGAVLARYYDNGNIRDFVLKGKDGRKFEGFLSDSGTTYRVPMYFYTPAVRFRNVSKIFTISDIHGQVELFKQILSNNGIIDLEGNWTWDDGHLVILGDVFDRGDYVNEVLYMIMDLEYRARRSGGQVHYLMGNHEAMVLLGDIRYVTDKYFAVAETFETTVPGLYGDNTLLGKWLRSKNTIIRINDILFVHGGIHPTIMNVFKSPRRLNKFIRDNLDTPWETIKSDTLLTLAFRGNGPLWYRGFFQPDSQPEVNREDLEQILDRFKVNRIITGHTTMDSISTFQNGRIIMVDAGIKNGLSGEALLWDGNTYFRVNDKGERIPLK
ncbi:MAG: metallophosphoesterase [Candidatus Neomarinimicrobiota bacterium]